MWIDARLGPLDARDIERAKAAETMAPADDGRERDLWGLPLMGQCAVFDLANSRQKIDKLRQGVVMHIIPS